MLWASLSAISPHLEHHPGFHTAEGDPSNLKLCQRGEWQDRMLVETVLSILTVSSTWKIRGGKVCSQGLDMTDQPICLVGYSASNFAGSARGLPFQEGDASGLGVFRSPSGVHHGRLQCAGPVAWPTAQRVWLRAPRDG